MRSGHTVKYSHFIWSIALRNLYQRRGPLWFCFGELRWLSFINDEFVAGLQGQTSLMIQKILRKITCLRSWMYCSILLASSGKKDEKAKIKQKFYWLSAKGYHCLPFAGHVVYSIHLVTVAESGVNLLSRRLHLLRKNAINRCVF